MVNRTNRNVAREVDKLTKSDAAAARNYIAKTLSSRNTNSKESPLVDDVIAQLANAHENRRARQVTEWERMPGQRVQVTA